jgi:hypothetical protein
MARLRSRITYANVTATLALFLALAGGTTAIALSGKNSVASDDIIKGQVKSSDIGGSQVANGDLAKDSVSGGKVKPETLFGGDIGADAIGASEIAAGAVGAPEIIDGAVGSGEQAAVPAARVTGTMPSISAGPFTDFVFEDDSDGDAYDPFDMWKPENPEQLTVPIPGMYVATATVIWPNDFTTAGTLQDQGHRLLQISGTGGETSRSVMGPSRFGTEVTYQTTAAILNLSGGGTITAHVAQDNEDDSALTNVSVDLAAVWIGPSPGPVN